MDAILDEALDELDDSDDDENDVSLESKDKENEHHFRLDVGTETPSKTIELQEAGEDSDEPESDRRASARAEGSPADVFQNMLRNFIEADEDGSDPDRRLDKFMDQVQSQLPPTEKEESPKHDTASPEDDDVKKTIAAIMEEMAKADIGDVSEEEMLKGMFQGLQDTGEDFNAESFNPDAVIDGMMEQLLSKDLMYTPMKQVTDKFPQWLEKNKDDLSVEEYQQ